MATLKNYAPPRDRTLGYFLTYQIVFKQGASFADWFHQRILIRWTGGIWTIEWKRVGVIGFLLFCWPNNFDPTPSCHKSDRLCPTHKSRFALQVKDADEWWALQNIGIPKCWSSDKTDQAWLAAGWTRCNCCRRDGRLGCEEVDNCLKTFPLTHCNFFLHNAVWEVKGLGSSTVVLYCHNWICHYSDAIFKPGNYKFATENLPLTNNTFCYIMCL